MTQLDVFVVFLVRRMILLLLLDDEDKIREELKDLIDDAPIDDEESDADSDGSGRNAKRKKSDDDDDELDDRLEDEDYELIEENLGVKVERVSDLWRLKELLPNPSYILETFQATQTNHRRGVGHRGARREPKSRSARR